MHEEYSDIPGRLIAAALCLLLAVCEYWPKKIKKFLLPFWYLTICYCLPFFGTYMFLINHASPTWSFNVILELFWLVLITDWLSFILTLLIGVTIGSIYYKISYGDIDITFSNMIGVYSNYIWAVVIAIIFSRQKEMILQVQKLEQSKQYLEA